MAIPEMTVPLMAPTVRIPLGKKRPQEPNMALTIGEGVMTAKPRAMV
jgi:hypothetical protein